MEAKAIPTDGTKPDAVKQMIRVVLVDSQVIYRVGVRKIFATESDIQVVAQFDNITDLQLAIPDQPADVLILEGSLIAGHADWIAEILRLAPGLKLIVEAAAADENRTVELYRNGARGIIPRSIPPEMLVKCVRKVAQGEMWIDNRSVSWVIEAYRSQATALSGSKNHPRLSPKELAIIGCITQGKRNKEIAHELGTSEQVIKNYLRKIYDKLGVSDRLELALYSLNNKIHLKGLANAAKTGMETSMIIPAKRA
ncbi:MAG TPA: response regulator transcription factor [Pseudacidobacterium sp.]|jgi:DNA-binding NarL/FixJ family response regulator|nr:response regulator transcription factor [Pseudacidobacterium sp.]